MVKLYMVGNDETLMLYDDAVKEASRLSTTFTEVCDFGDDITVVDESGNNPCNVQ